eukprot:1547679-Prymnesium_polylepis.1
MCALFRGESRMDVCVSFCARRGHCDRASGALRSRAFCCTAIARRGHCEVRWVAAFGRFVSVTFCFSDRFTFSETVFVLYTVTL